jgi:hypothetical protein
LGRLSQDGSGFLLLTRFTRIDLVVAALLALVGAAAIGAPAAVPGTPGIYVNYELNCTFRMSVDGGISIASSSAPGPTLPPGTYNLAVTMPNPAAGYTGCARPLFALTGPGVNSVIEFRGEELVDERLTTLQTSSTYVAEDRNAPGDTRKVFTTAASGSNSVLLGGSNTQSGPTKTSPQSGIVGSAIVRYRGQLVATVTAAGKATLKRAGRTVRSLQAGRYEFKVADAAPRAGFFLQRGSRKAVTVAGLAFVGKRTRRIVLAAGKWTFFSKAGKPIPFTVVA